MTKRQILESTRYPEQRLKALEDEYVK